MFIAKNYKVYTHFVEIASNSVTNLHKDVDLRKRIKHY